MGVGKDRELITNGYMVSFWKDEEVPKLTIVIDGCIIQFYEYIKKY